MAATAQEIFQFPTPPTLIGQLRVDCEKLLERTREALLEARDETDVRWIRDAAIRSLKDIFKDVPTFNDPYVLLKLDTLELVDGECAIGHCNALIRTRKWRKALITRYFGE